MNNCEVSVEFVDAAVELVSFCRTTPYPEMGSPEFIKLTELMDSLDTQVRKYVKEKKS